MEDMLRDAAELAQRATRGDGDAFAQLAEGVKTSLYTAAWAILGNPADALDAVDDTIYKAYRSIRRLREPQYFKTWITRILINTCRSELSRKYREAPLVIDREEARWDSHEEFSVRDAVRLLPPELNDIIALRYFADMTIADTARVLGLPEGTIKTRQRRALALLRLELREEEA